MTQEDCMLSGTLFIVTTKEMVFLIYSIIKYFSIHFYHLLYPFFFFLVGFLLGVKYAVCTGSLVLKYLECDSTDTPLHMQFSDNNKIFK